MNFTLRKECGHSACVDSNRCLFACPSDTPVPEATPAPKVDMVNSPPHYTAGSIECIDAIQEATKGLEGIEAYCTAAAIKYLWRWKRKNGVEDLQKCVWYVNRIIEGQAK